jgi:lipopolysaccharide transport system ATP-binding protein
MSSDTAIRIAGLGKRYRLNHGGAMSYLTLRERLAGMFASRRTATTATEFDALRGPHLVVARGQRLGIIGRNGAGKSTLLKILSRITPPTSGRVEIHGRVASLLEVGTGFHPELSGRENIFLNGSILGMGRAEIRRKFDEIVAFAEVEQFLDTPVKRYSSGMYVRLAFAVAAHLEPEILIVDEVLAVGDIAFQRKCMGKMEDIARRGNSTVLFVTHNMDAVLTLCSRCVVLEKGRAIFDGAPAAAVERYLHTLETSSRREGAPADRPHIESVDVDVPSLRDSRLAVAVRFRSPTELKAPNVGIVVYDALGRPVFGTNTKLDLDGGESISMRAGCARLEVGDVPLRSGHYHIAAWLGDATQDYDHLPGAAAFEIVATGYRGQVPPVETIGSVKVAAKWRIDETAQVG